MASTKTTAPKQIAPGHQARDADERQAVVDGFGIGNAYLIKTFLSVAKFSLP
jgi:hypothetical protein